MKWFLCLQSNTILHSLRPLFPPKVANKIVPCSGGSANGTISKAIRFMDLIITLLFYFILAAIYIC